MESRSLVLGGPPRPAPVPPPCRRTEALAGLGASTSVGLGPVPPGLPPAGIMVILFVHCLRDIPLTRPRAAAPLGALAVTLGLHLWRRNALLSILGGSAASVALAGTFFAS
ncbi:AzlD domain-containing protein [Streptoverticillium reticulum]|uniref:AzlD domain-containing protein n=1 Tax=Streptoverticillium reticulum TaxID=1433415 RepID=UPI0039BFE5A0